jgi:heptosyltransferase-2
LIEKILCVRTDRMGDLLLSLPAVHALRQAFPDTQITLILQHGLEDLLQDHPDLDQVQPWDPCKGQGWGEIFRWSWRLRQEQFDVAVVFNPTQFFHVATFLAGIPLRIGYRRKWGFLLSRSILDTKASRQLDEVEFNLELVRLLGISTSQPQLILPRDPKAEEECRQFLARQGQPNSQPPIAVHPWTSHPSKAWPLESFSKVIEQLATFGRPILIIGGPESSDSMSRWEPTLSVNVVDLVGRLPLRLLPALLRGCALLISNDSGPVHVAAAVGIPTVVVAPQEHARLLRRWCPSGQGHLLLLSPKVEEVISSVRESLS